MSKVKLRREDLEYTFDIDGFFGVFNSNSVHGILADIILTYSDINNIKILNKDIMCSTINGFFKLKNFHNIEIANFKVTPFKNARIFIVCDSIRNDEYNNDVQKLRSFIEQSLKFSIIKYKSDHEDLVLEYLLETTSNKKFAKGLVKADFLSLFLIQLNFLKKLSFIGFYEIYDTKNSLVYDSIDSYDYFLNTLFDFEKILPRTDVSINLNFLGNQEYTLSLEAGFIMNEKIKSYHTMFNSNSFANINQTTVIRKNFGKLAKGDQKLCPLLNGIFKINFYTPVVKNLLSIDYRNFNKPVHGLTLLASDCYGYKSKKYKKSKEINLIKKLKDSIGYINSNYESVYPIRFEINTLVTNIHEFENFMLDLIADRYYFITSTDNIIDKIIVPFIASIKNIMLNDDCKKNSNLDFTGMMMIYEMIVFEYFIKGGKNNHSIPKTCTEFIKHLQIDNFLVCSSKVFECELSKQDIGYTLSRSIHYSGLFNEHEKNSYYDLLEAYCGLIDLAEITGLIVKNFLNVYEKDFEGCNKVIMHKIDFSPNEFLKYNFYQPLNVIKKTSYTMLLKFAEENFNLKDLNKFLILSTYHLNVTEGFFIDNSHRKCKRKIDFDIELDNYVEPLLVLNFVHKEIIFKAKTVNRNRLEQYTDSLKKPKCFPDVKATAAEILYYKFCIEKLKFSKSEKLI